MHLQSIQKNKHIMLAIHEKNGPAAGNNFFLHIYKFVDGFYGSHIFFTWCIRNLKSYPLYSPTPEHENPTFHYIYTLTRELAIHNYLNILPLNMQFIISSSPVKIGLRIFYPPSFWQEFFNYYTNTVNFVRISTFIYYYLSF